MRQLHNTNRLTRQPTCLVSINKIKWVKFYKVHWFLMKKVHMMGNLEYFRILNLSKKNLAEPHNQQSLSKDIEV